MGLENFFDDGEKRKKKLTLVKERRKNQRKLLDGRKLLVGELEFLVGLGWGVDCLPETGIFLDEILSQKKKKTDQRPFLLFD